MDSVPGEIIQPVPGEGYKVAVRLYTWPMFLAYVPMKRLTSADEVAYGILYLASDESSFVTGAELVIDCGMTDQ